MSLREEWDRLTPDAFVGEDVVIREIRDDDDLWYAVVECTLAPGQEEFVNPAGFSIGRAYLHPADAVPCVICLEDGTRIGYIVFREWVGPGAGRDYNWSYYLDKAWQGQGYGEKAARLAVRIFGRMDETVPIKLSTEADNRRAQRLYEKIGFRRLDELDGDDLVFCLIHDHSMKKEEKQV